MRLTSRDTLRALVRQRDFTYEELGELAGCSKGFIGHLIGGFRKTCTPELADRIAEELDVPRDLLFMEEESSDRGRNMRGRSMNGRAS